MKTLSSVSIDKSVVEVFVNGKQCIATRVYPSREDAVGVSIRSQGEDSELKLFRSLANEVYL